MIDPNEIEIEPIRGLPGPLPGSERILWQGAPDWRALAVQAFHTRKVAFYFGLLIAWQAWSGWSDGEPPAALALAAAKLSLGAAAAVAILSLLAWLYARTSVYTVTTRRLVIRSGLALPITFNLPFAQVESAALSKIRDGVGSICFRIAKPNRVALLVVWPHARPWAWNEPQPTLRSIPDAAGVARLVADVLRREAGPAPALVAERPAGVAAPVGAAAGLAA